MQTASSSPLDDPIEPLSHAGERMLLVCGIVVLIVTLIAGYLAYLSPAMLIEFASLRLCS